MSGDVVRWLAERHRLTEHPPHEDEQEDRAQSLATQRSTAENHRHIP